MFAVYINNKTVSLRPSDMIGEGGEAEVYKVDNDTALKLFKQPNHPSFRQDSNAANLSKQRLLEHQTKLIQFPKRVAPHVVEPKELVYSSSNRNEVIGYTMRRITPAHSMHEFSQRAFQESSGVSTSTIVDIFSDLHASVSTLHNNGIVIGDFNHLNVLISAESAYIIDADSMQFSTFRCRTFTARYADPKLLQIEHGAINLVGNYSEDTDWYAFSMMLFEALLHVHPYGGVYKPKQKAPKVSPEERSLKRISVLNQDVVYPAAAKTIADTLSEDLVKFYQNLLIDDLRIPFPLPLLQTLVAPTVSAMAGTSAQTRALSTSTSKTQAPAKTVQQPGSRLVFSTAGVILCVTHDGANLRYLYNDNNSFIREDGNAVLNGALDPQLKFAIQNTSTIVGKGNRSFVFSGDNFRQQISTDQFRGGEPVFACNDMQHFFVEDGQLFASQSGGKLKMIDEVLKDQTRIWSGPRFGFSFYLAGDFKRAFLFNGETTGRKLIDVNALSGTLLRVNCRFSEERLWLIVTTEINGQLFNKVSVFDSNGHNLGSAETPEDSGTWTDSAHQSCAAALPAKTGGTIETLFVATNDGLVQVEADGKSLRITTALDGTENLLEPGDNLLFSAAGLYAWNAKSIRLLNIA